MTGARPETSAIVLAGGRSSRFGSDKLAMHVGGIPLLERAVRAVASVCDEVVLVIAEAGPVPDVPPDVKGRTRVVRDETAYPGPLAALHTGAGAATAERLLIVGGDMPVLQPAVLDRLLCWEHGHGACLVAGGHAQVLPFAATRPAVVVTAHALLAVGHRSLRALLGRLDVEAIDEDQWRALDPDAASLRDVDVPADLERR